jgi:hypothetical protein
VLVRQAEKKVCGLRRRAAHYPVNTHLKETTMTVTNLLSVAAITVIACAAIALSAEAAPAAPTHEMQAAVRLAPSVVTPQRVRDATAEEIARAEADQGR